MTERINKVKKQKLIWAVLIFVVASVWVVYALKGSYEKKNESKFLMALNQKVQDYNGPFLLSDVTDFEWDKVCILSEVDDSYPVIPTKRYIQSKGFKFGHWTQAVPHFSLASLIGAALTVPIGEYEIALIFVKDNAAVKVIKFFNTAVADHELYTRNAPNFEERCLQKAYVTSNVHDAWKTKILTFSEN